MRAECMVCKEDFKPNLNCVTDNYGEVVGVCSDCRSACEMGRRAMGMAMCIEPAPGNAIDRVRAETWNYCLRKIKGE